MNLAIAIIVALFVLLDQCSGGGNQTSQNANTNTNAVTALLNAQNNSGEVGTVNLSATGDNQTTVLINVTGMPASASQPAHIHLGSCAHLDPAPKYALNPVVNGTSSTKVNASLSELTSGSYAVNIHQSAEKANVYVSCADLSNAGSAPSSAGTPIRPAPSASSSRPVSGPSPTGSPIRPAPSPKPTT